MYASDSPLMPSSTVSHTGQLMFDVFEQAMDAIIPGWEEYLLSTCSDGARNMLGRTRGIVARIAQCCRPHFHPILVWCSPVRPCWEKDEYRSALMNFSLEGIMHWKQFKALQAIT
jgi:hypothetical protein